MVQDDTVYVRPKKPFALRSGSLIAAIRTKTWDETKDCMDTLEALFDQTKLFRKFT